MSKMVNKHNILKIRFLLVLVWGFGTFLTTHLYAGFKTDTHTYIVSKDEGKLLILDHKMGQEQVIDVGEYPLEMVVHNGFCYIANKYSNEIKILDLKTNQFTSKIILDELDKIEHTVSLFSSNNNLFILRKSWPLDRSVLFLVDMRKSQVTNLLMLEGAFQDIVCHGDSIYALLSSPNTIAVLDPKEFKIHKTISLENNPYNILFHKDFGYVCNSDFGIVSVLDLKTLTLRSIVKIGLRFADFMIHEGFGYAICSHQDEVAVLDLQSHTVVKRLPVGLTPCSMLIHNGYGYVVNINNHFLSVLNLKTQSFECNLFLGNKFRSMVIHKNSGYVFGEVNKVYITLIIDLESHEVRERLKLPNKHTLDFSNTHLYFGVTKGPALPGPGLSLFKKPFEGIEGFYSEEDADLAFDEFEKAALRKEYKTARHWFTIALSWGDKKAYAVAFKALCHGLWGAQQSDFWATQFSDGMDVKYLNRIVPDVSDLILSE